MFLSSNNYKSHVEALIAASDRLKIAVAFWGAGSETLFEGYQGESVQVICNLLSGGTNPYAIENLARNPKVTIRHSTSLHAKVLLGTGVAIVGSANLSTDGLNHEPDEYSGWFEAGIEVKATAELAHIDNWFTQRWTSADSIDPMDLALAKKQWALRRQNRIPMSKAAQLSQVSSAEVRDLQVYVVMYKLDASAQADFKFQKGKATLESKDMVSETALRKLDFFEDWDNLPIGADLICIHLSDTGRPRVDGVFRRAPDLDSLFNGRASKSRIQIVKPTSLASGLRFPRSDWKAFAARIANVIGAYHGSSKEVGKHLALHAALEQAAAG